MSRATEGSNERLPWTVDAWMTRDVVTVEASSTLGHAARLIASQMVSCVIVLEEGRPVGIVTERDIAVCAAVQARVSIEDVPIEEVMGKPLIGVSPRDTLREALRRVERLHIRHVPVLDEKGDLAGILTQSDLLHAFAEMGARAPESSPESAP